MNSIKTVKGLLSQDFTIKAFDGKESKESLDSQKGSNYKRKQTKAFDEKESEEFLDSFSLVHRKDNGYSVTEGSKL